MNNGQKVLAGMLAVVVVVLGLLAFAPKPPEPPRIIAISTATDTAAAISFHAIRLWSDGVIEQNTFLPSGSGWSGWQVVPE